jgi:hypothetical protein
MLRTHGVVIREGRGGANREFTYKLLGHGVAAKAIREKGGLARAAPEPRPPRRLAAATALFVRPSLAALFDQQPNDRQRSDAVDPPRADSPLSAEANDDDH